MYWLVKCCQGFVSDWLVNNLMDGKEDGGRRHFLLQEAIDLMRARRPNEAYPVLAQYLRINPKSEDGWLLMSYIVQDPEKKIECLERVLDINPNNIPAMERLDKFEEVEFEEARKPKTLWGFPVWAIFAITIVLGVAILIGGYWAFVRVIGPARIGAQVTIVSLTPTQTFTPVFATMTPTSTPTPSPTILASPTPPPLDEDTEEQMQEIQSQVIELRGLAQTNPLTRAVISLEHVRPLLESIYLDRHTKDEVADQVRVLSILGFIEPTYDLYTKTLNQIGEGIGGFYVPWTDQLYVIGTEFSGIERFVYSHEYDHALVDQHYALDKVGVYPECLSDSDRCLAISALVEGDAMYLMYQWLEQYATEDDILQIIEAQYAPLDYTISSSNLPPPFAVREMQFRYGDGAEFVDHLYQIGKWEMINRAYETLPQTSEQILHPEKYQVREGARQVEIPDFALLLGVGWRKLHSDSLGELGTEMLLAYGIDRLTQIDLETAIEAATGWGGDHYQVFYKGTTNERVLVANWTWDSKTDADQFWAAMEEYLYLRFLNDTVGHPKGPCWRKSYEEYTCIFRSGFDTLWVIAPELHLVEAIRKEFDTFK
jgi:hypothetical protein